MATKEQLEVCSEILSLSAKISIQRKVCVIAGYDGNTDSFSVHLYQMPIEVDAIPVPGWRACDHIVYLGDWSLTFEFDSTLAISRLEKIYADLSAFLDVDADGVPV